MRAVASWEQLPRTGMGLVGADGSVGDIGVPGYGVGTFVLKTATVGLVPVWDDLRVFPVCVFCLCVCVSRLLLLYVHITICCFSLIATIRVSYSPTEPVCGAMWTTQVP